MQDANPFFEPWTGPFGLPPFDRIMPWHYLPAFKAGMEQEKAELAAISGNPDAPTFDNTIIALERRGSLLKRVNRMMEMLVLNDTSPVMKWIDSYMDPRLTKHSNSMYADQALFTRIKEVYDQRDNLPTEAQRRLTEKYYGQFFKEGAHLPPTELKKAATLKVRLSTLSTKFKNNITADTNASAVLLDSLDECAGLPDTFIETAAEAAKEKGQDGKYLVKLGLSNVLTFLSAAERRDVRERVYRAYKGRCENGDQHDNRELAVQIAEARRELAKLMGYDDYASYKLSDHMARTPATVAQLQETVWAPARATLLREQEKLKEVAAADGMNEELQPWDWQYYAEKVRQRDFNFSEEEVSKYLTLDNAIAGAFYTANRLFGVTFTPCEDLQLYHPDVRVWEVKDKDGQHIALFMGDYYSRNTKRPGAWMWNLRDNNGLAETSTPIVYNACNFAKGADNAPTLLSIEDYTTAFHKLGHGLHGMLSKVLYPALAGTSVVRDFVELPSQIFELWCFNKDVTDQFLRHHKTGEPMPEELRQRILAARGFNQGYETAATMASAIMDAEWHGAGDISSVEIVEQRARDRMNLPDVVAPRHRSAHFNHIFVGGYSAGYYGYLWADVMAADAFSAFTEAGDDFDPKTASKLRQIYTMGDAVAPETLYRQFRGRDVSADALLAHRGLTVDVPAPTRPKSGTKPDAQISTPG